MATTYNFEELDEATHDYLAAVRDSEGLGSPGVFVATSDSLPGCGCIAGPIIIVVTLALTLTTWVNIIYKDPVNVAFLQTAGLLVGGWLLFAGFRGSKGSNKVAGTWVFVDPLYLYEAYREQVTVTPIDEAVEAHFTHNYNNGAYQNSVIHIALGGKRSASVTVVNEARAEQMVVYLNYLAWARGPDGGERANLPAATLGGLAKYVAKNDHEPLDAESNINLNLIELDITEVPEQPQRTGTATPAIIPYLVMFGCTVVCFLFMAFVINPTLRDDAIYDAVMKDPIEPRVLRAYLIDQRNTMHRKTVIERLSRFYGPPIDHVKKNGNNPELRDGLAKVLESVREADQPVVSVRVTEKGTPAGKEGSKATREEKLRTDFVNGLNGEFSRHSWGVAVQPPAGMVFSEPPPVGQQLLAFIEAPEGADKVHFDITYTIEQADFGSYKIRIDVEIRSNIEDAAGSKATLVVPGPAITAADFDTPQSLMTRMKDELVRSMAGITAAPGVVPGGNPPVFNPNP